MSLTNADTIQCLFLKTYFFQLRFGVILLPCAPMPTRPGHVLGQQSCTTHNSIARWRSSGNGHHDDGDEVGSQPLMGQRMGVWCEAWHTGSRALPNAVMLQVTAAAACYEQRDFCKPR